ncbi:MAG: hypothetical protein ACJ71W_22135 [Terriglobales bacterium]
MNELRSSIGYMLLELALNIFPLKERLIIGQAFVEKKDELLAVKY